MRTRTQESGTPFSAEVTPHVTPLPFFDISLTNAVDGGRWELPERNGDSVPEHVREAGSRADGPRRERDRLPREPRSDTVRGNVAVTRGTR